MQDRALHPNSRTVLDAWRRLTLQPGLAGAADDILAPEDLVSNLFVLQRTLDDAWIFRNAGERLQDLMGRELAEVDFMSLWSGHDRDRVSALIETIAADREPGIIRTGAESTAEAVLDVEILLAPISLTRRAQPSDRMLGLYQTLSPTARLMGRPVYRHAVTQVAPVSRIVERAKLRLVVSNA